VGGLLGESEDEDAESVAVRGLDINDGLDQAVPLLHERAELVGGEVHAVEVEENAATADILGDEAHLAEGLVLGILLEVGERDLENATLETLRRDLRASGAVHEGLANLTLSSDYNR
jgi:hypothetical protein